MIDMVIRGGTVVDGSGRDGQRADIAVSGGRIVTVGEVDDRVVGELELGAVHRRLACPTPCRNGRCEKPR